MILLAAVLASTAFASPESNFLEDLDLFKQRSLALRTDKEAVSAAGSNTLSHFFQFTPRVILAGGHEWATSEAPAQLYLSSSDDWYWRAAADWNLFRGGGDYFSWRAAQKNEASQKYTLGSQELKTEVDGSNAIFRRLYLRDYKGAQDELLKLKQETLRIGHDRYKAGKISLQDVVKMEVDLSQQQNVVRQSEIDQAENEAVYRSFFVDALKTNDWPFSAKDAIFPSTEGLSFQQLSLRTNADALDYTWKSARARYLPSLDLTASYKSFESYGQMAKQWNSMIELSIPLWSRWEVAAQSAQDYAASVKAQDEAEQNARDESLRREFLQKKVNLSRANMDDARTNLDRANHLYEDMLRSFQLGRLSTNDLFLEQDRKIRAIVDYAQARLDFHSSIMEACALRGLTATECLK